MTDDRLPHFMWATTGSSARNRTSTDLKSNKMMTTYNGFGQHNHPSAPLRQHSAGADLTRSLFTIPPRSPGTPGRPPRGAGGAVLSPNLQRGSAAAMSSSRLDYDRNLSNQSQSGKYRPHSTNTCTGGTRHQSLWDLQPRSARRSYTFSSSKSTKSTPDTSAERPKALLDIYGLPNGSGPESFYRMLDVMKVKQPGSARLRLKREPRTGERFARVTFGDRADILEILLKKGKLIGDPEYSNVIFKKPDATNIIYG